MYARQDPTSARHWTNCSCQRMLWLAKLPLHFRHHARLRSSCTRCKRPHDDTWFNLPCCCIARRYWTQRETIGISTCTITVSCCATLTWPTEKPHDYRIRGYATEYSVVLSQGRSWFHDGSDLGVTTAWTLKHPWHNHKRARSVRSETGPAIDCRLASHDPAFATPVWHFI